MSKYLFYLSYIIVFGIEVGLLALLSFRLTVTSYAVYQQIINILPVCVSIVSLGSPFAVVYFRARGFKCEKFLKKSNTRAIEVGLILTVFASFSLQHRSDLHYVSAALMLAILGAVKQNSINFFIGSGNLTRAAEIRVIQRISFAIIIYAIAVVVELEPYMLMVSLVAAELFGLLVLLMRLELFIIRYVRLYDKISAVISGYSFLSNVISSLLYAMPIFFLSILRLNKLEFAQASLAIVLTRYANLGAGPVIQLVIPRVAPLKNNIAESMIMFRRGFVRWLILCSIGSFSLWLLIEPIQRIAFAEEYERTSAFVKILAWGIPASVLCSYTAAFLSGLGNIKYVLVTTAISLFISLIICSIAVLLNSGISEFFMLIVLSQYITLAAYLVSFSIHSRQKIISRI